jgi:hypothetical protein
MSGAEVSSLQRYKLRFDKANNDFVKELSEQKQTWGFRQLLTWAANLFVSRLTFRSRDLSMFITAFIKGPKYVKERKDFVRDHLATFITHDTIEADWFEYDNYLPKMIFDETMKVVIEELSQVYDDDKVKAELLNTICRWLNEKHVDRNQLIQDIKRILQFPGQPDDFDRIGDELLKQYIASIDATMQQIMNSGRETRGSQLQLRNLTKTQTEQMDDISEIFGLIVSSIRDNIKQVWQVITHDIDEPRSVTATTAATAATPNKKSRKYGGSSSATGRVTKKRRETPTLQIRVETKNKNIEFFRNAQLNYRLKHTRYPVTIMVLTSKSHLNDDDNTDTFTRLISHAMAIYIYVYGGKIYVSSIGYGHSGEDYKSANRKHDATTCKEYFKGKLPKSVADFLSDQLCAKLLDIYTPDFTKIKLGEDLGWNIVAVSEVEIHEDEFMKHIRSAGYQMLAPIDIEEDNEWETIEGGTTQMTKGGSTMANTVKIARTAGTANSLYNLGIDVSKSARMVKERALNVVKKEKPGDDPTKRVISLQKTITAMWPYKLLIFGTGNSADVNCAAGIQDLHEKLKLQMHAPQVNGFWGNALLNTIWKFVGLVTPSGISTGENSLLRTNFASSKVPINAIFILYKRLAYVDKVRNALNHGHESETFKAIVKELRGTYTTSGKHIPSKQSKLFFQNNFHTQYGFVFSKNITLAQQHKNLIFLVKGSKEVVKGSKGAFRGYVYEIVHKIRENLGYLNP